MTRKHFGLDCETPLGDLRVIATNEEVAEVNTFEDVMAFIGKHKYHGAIFWMFNQQFDCEHILKTTGDKAFLQDLYDNGVQRPGVEYKGYHIQYIQGKLMKICKNKHCASFYDIAQFYKGASLEKASKQYLPKELQKDTSSIDRARLGSEPGYYEDNREKTLAYCMQDAIATLALAKLMETTFTSRGISFRSPISQAKISQIYVTDNYPKMYPKIPPGLERIHNTAHQAYHGGMFQTYQRGYFDQPVYCFDIKRLTFGLLCVNSAYPAVMATLPNWSNGEFHEVFSPSGARFGWYGCEFDCQYIPQFEMKPQTFKEEMNGYGEVEITFNNKRKIYPTGKRKQWITAAEYYWMKKHGFPIEFKYGYEWAQLNNKYPSPFEWMPRIYKERKEIVKKDKTGMLQYALKILLNGLYGKTCEFKHGAGPLTNFFYGSYITAETRLMVADVALKHPKEIIEIATDSVTLTEDISSELAISDELGEWGLDEYTEALFIGSGMRQEWFIDDKGKKAFKTHARGLTNWGEYDMKADLEKNRKLSELVFVRKRPIHMGEMLAHVYKLHFEDLGVFMDVKKHLRVNTDTKSKWARDYVNFGDFLDSKPMGGKPLLAA